MRGEVAGERFSGQSPGRALSHAAGRGRGRPRRPRTATISPPPPDTTPTPPHLPHPSNLQASSRLGSTLTSRSMSQQSRFPTWPGLPGAGLIELGCSARLSPLGDTTLHYIH